MATREKIREGMTKQDYIQKYLEDILGDAWRKGTRGKGINVTEEANQARLHLTKWGAVIKVEKDLPDNEAWHKVEREFEAYCAGRNDMVKWHNDSFEPLIKEVEMNLKDVLVEQGQYRDVLYINKDGTVEEKRCLIVPALAVEPLIEDGYGVMDGR